MTPPAVLPITPSTVTINGSVHSGRQMIWAGLKMSAGIAFHDHSGRTLHVPFRHIDAPGAGFDADDPVYALRPRDERYRFARARNGAWILRLETETLK